MTDLAPLTAREQCPDCGSLDHEEVGRFVHCRNCSMWVGMVVDGVWDYQTTRDYVERRAKARAAL